MPQPCCRTRALWESLCSRRPRLVCPLFNCSTYICIYFQLCPPHIYAYVFVFVCVSAHALDEVSRSETLRPRRNAAWIKFAMSPRIASTHIGQRKMTRSSQRRQRRQPDDTDIDSEVKFTHLHMHKPYAKPSRRRRRRRHSRRPCRRTPFKPSGVRRAKLCGLRDPR